jgi:sialidase-1
MLARKLIVAPGDANSTHYRIPAVITANDGSVILFTDKRKFNNTDLPEDIDVVTHRSTDNGKTWSAATTIAQGTGVGAGFGDVATVKTKTGKIIALFAGGAGFGASTSSNPIKVYKSESTDNGISWSAPTDITSQLYAQGCTDPTVQHGVDYSLHQDKCFIQAPVV